MSEDGTKLTEYCKEIWKYENEDCNERIYKDGGRCIGKLKYTWKNGSIEVYESINYKDCGPFTRYELNKKTKIGYYSKKDKIFF